METPSVSNRCERRQRPSTLSLAELMTLVILFHQLRFRQFKSFYLGTVCRHLRAEFPRLPSYHRCMELLPRCAVPLAALFTLLKGECDGISLADATALAVCDNRRISRHQVFKKRNRRARQDLHGLVLRLQAARHHQLERRADPPQTDARQRR
jgi:hypothetical protein